MTQREEESPGAKSAVVGTGLVAGVVTVVIALSLSALVFSGPLAVALPVASTFVLAATAGMNLILARTTSLPGAVMIPQDATSAITATALSAAVVGLTVEAAITTSVVVIVAGTVITAGVLLLLGGFRLGSLVRYIPYPVMGGFLAGTGVLLLTGAGELMTGGFVWSTASVVALGAGTALGAFLLVIAEKKPHPFSLPASIVGAVVLFYAALATFGVSLEEARTLGLLGAEPASSGLSGITFGPVDWSVVRSTAPALVTIPIVAVVSLLLNAGGLEYVSGRDADLDAELRAAGLANLAGAAGGAAAGYHAVSLSAFGYRAGVSSRAVTVIVAAVCGAGAFVGPVLVTFLPTPVIGALLAMLGLSFLYDWVIGGYRRMTYIEYLLMLVIALGMVVLGFLIGIAFGLAAAVLLFAATYSRLDPIRHTFTGLERVSSVERPARDRAILAEEGGAVRIVELEGFLFFGTAHSAARAIRRMLATDDARALVLELRRVQGLDSTAALALAKLERELRTNDLVMIVSNAAEDVTAALMRAGMTARSGVVYVSDLDHALEYCENLLLEGAEGDYGNPWLLADEYWNRLLPHMDRIVLRAGEVLAELGVRDQSIFIIQSGKISAEIPVGEGRWQRVRSAGPGGVLGEMAMYGDGQRSARLTVEEDGVMLRLSTAAIARLEASDPDCAIAFHRALARVLTNRLTTSNEFIRALVR